MRSLKIFVPLIILMAGCDSGSMSVSAPDVNISGVGSPGGVGSPDDAPSLPARKSHGAPEVWLAPNIQSNALDMFRYPEQWVKVRGRLDVFGMYMLWAYDHPGFECPTCGPNTYGAFRDVVPGGAFRWLSAQGIKIAIEAPSLKEQNCDDPLAGAKSVIVALSNIATAGGKVSYVAMDEPFTAGLSPIPGEPIMRPGCSMSVPAVAERVKNYTQAIRSAHPGVQVGLIEAYPYFSVAQIKEFVLELERQGVTLPFLHIDFFLYAARVKDLNYVTELAELRSFSQQHGIPFGVILFGANGASSGEFHQDVWATALGVKTSVGVTDHFILQSWAEQHVGDAYSPRTEPHTLPEDEPTSLTGIMLRMFKFFGIAAN